MKYAAVAAALAGVAVADYSWAPLPTTKSKPVDPDTTWSAVYTTKAVDPATWVPVKATTTKSQCTYVTEVPVKKCRPGPPGKPEICRDDKTKTTYYADACTWSDWVDPATKTIWEDVPYVATTTKSQCAYVTEVPVKKCKPGKPDECWETKTKTTIYADTCTWSDWVDPATKATWGNVPVDVTTTVSKCSYVTEVPVKKCKDDDKKNCWDEKTKTTIYADSCTWSNIVDSDTKATWSDVVVTKTETWANVPVVTSVVTPGWTKDGWFGPAWPTATDKCNVNVVTSYGAPVWKPVPEAPTKPVVPAPGKETPYVPVKGDGKGSAPIAPNGNKWSMTYTPYDAKGLCKTEEVIKKDMGDLASRGFTSVRVYSTKCDTLKFIGDACRANGLKMILGVFIDKYGVNGDLVKEQVKAIVEWKQWDIVELIVIGNEALYQGFCKTDELVWLVKDCKEKFAAAGYTGACTTTEPLSSWQKDGSKFCAVVDVVSANLYAYFNADTTCDMAGDFVQSEIEILEKICPGKTTYVMESGWPSAGNCNGKACPGKEEQKKAIKSIQEKCGAKIVFFSFEDELWKESGKFNVEQHWGCSDVFEATWKPVTVTSTTASATTWGGWTTTTKAVDPTTTWAAY